MVEAAGDGATRTFLIADIRGYTAFTAEQGDEAGSRLAARFSTITAEGVEAWSGRLVELRGDEALCAFDDPVAALRASIELQDAFAEETAADETMPLRVGIGLATGGAVPLGDGFRGSSLNLAARLCSLSDAGEVHASVALVEATGDVEGLEMEEVGDLDLKGLETEQRAFRVRSAEPCPAGSLPGLPSEVEGRAPPRGLDTSGVLVGRDAEIRWLGWHWRRARHGHARTVLLEGAPGVGKTRLLATLATKAAGEGADVAYETAPGAVGRTNGPPDEAGPHPRLRIIDGAAGATWAFSEAEQGSAEGTRCLTVVARTIGDRDPGSRDARTAGLPCLELRPLDLDGIRALGQALSPETADELPIARILETSGGLPGPARAAVNEWAERIEAERRAGLDAGSLPAEPSSFVGRVHELQRLRALLEHTRLLTLTGPPGTGKTRLAIQLARALSDRYADGTVFVPLASLRDEALVGGAIAHAMQLRESPEATPLEVVKAYLAQRQVLLVIDNFEHLAGAASQVGELLGASPLLRMVVTSRSALGVSGEQAYPVPPLALPSGALDVASVAACDAAALFVLRARAVDPAFDLRSENAGTVAAIVGRLDGLPLAIELAAARIRTLGPAGLLEHLDRRLPILTGGAVDQAERHQTMRDAIAWSYELLSDDEQTVLRHLSIFRGGLTLDAAARVADRPELEVIDIVDGLVSGSLLVRRELHGRVRLAMLELVREYARDELEGAGEEQVAIDRHASVYLDLARELEPIFEGRTPGDAQVRMAPEIDNLRAALDRACERGDVETSLELAARPWRFWQSIGQLAEGRSWVERALALSGGSVPARARATAALGGLTYWQGDFKTSRESYRRARDLYTATGDKAAETNAVYSLSLLATYEGELDAADRYADEAMELARGSGNDSMIAEVLAAQFLVAWQKGELGRARGLTEATLEIAGRLGLSAMTATSLVALAGISFQQGDTDQALGHAAEALELAIGIENIHTQVFALDSIASFAAKRSPVESVRLCGAAEALNKEHGGGFTLESMGVDCARTAAAGLLEEEELARAYEDGAGMDLATAVEAARSILAEVGGGQPAG